MRVLAARASAYWPGTCLCRFAWHPPRRQLSSSGLEIGLWLFRPITSWHSATEQVWLYRHASGASYLPVVLNSHWCHDIRHTFVKIVLEQRLIKAITAVLTLDTNHNMRSAWWVVWMYDMRRIFRCIALMEFHNACTTCVLHTAIPRVRIKSIQQMNIYKRNIQPPYILQEWNFLTVAFVVQCWTLQQSSSLWVLET